MATEVKVRLKITLATEQFSGPDHTGNSSVAYMLNHPVIIFDHENSLRWRQDRDREGHMDQEHLPGSGPVEIVQGDCTLSDEKTGKPVVKMLSFTNPISNQGGAAEYKYKAPTLGPQRNSVINYSGRGVWEVVDDRSSPPPVHQVFSEWKFNTSASTGVGGLVVEFGSGTITLTDPYKVDRRFAYLGGGGSMDAAKILGLIKRLKDLVWLGKLTKGVSTATKGGGSESTEDQFSTGFIMKNYLSVGSRELTADDFTGMCIWVDGSLGVYRAASGMFLLTHVRVCRFGGLTFHACIPCGGIIKTPVGAGVGLCVGGLTMA